MNVLLTWAVPLSFGRLLETNTWKMEPFVLASRIIAANHLQHRPVSGDFGSKRPLLRHTSP